MNGVTRRVLLAGAALLPMSLSVRAATVNDDSKLLDLVAQWWRFENAVNQRGLTDEERDDLTERQNLIVGELAALPANTNRELTAKLKVVWQYHIPPGNERIACERLFESILTDAERLAGAS